MCVTVGNNFLKVPLLNAWMTDLTALSFTWNLKKHPFRADPPGIRHYREYPYNVTFGWLAVHVSRRNKHVITFALHALRKNKVFEGSTNQTMTKTYIIKDSLLWRRNFKKGARNLKCVRNNSFSLRAYKHWICLCESHAQCVRLESSTQGILQGRSPGSHKSRFITKC